MNTELLTLPNVVAIAVISLLFIVMVRWIAGAAGWNLPDL